MSTSEQKKSGSPKKVGSPKKSITHESSRNTKKSSGINWDWWSTGKIALIIIALLVIYVILKAVLGPIYGALSGPFGAVNAAGAALSDIIGSCSKNGWFSTSCGLGIFAAVAGGLYVLVWVVAKFTSRDANSLVAQAENATGKTGLELAVESASELRDKMPSMEEKLKELKMEEPGHYAYARALQVAEDLKNKTKKALETQQNTPQQLDEKKAALQVSYNEALVEAEHLGEENDVDMDDREKIREAFIEK